MDYPFPSIWINGRTVSLHDICEEEAQPLTPFEDHTFTFIRDWLSGEETFLVQTSGSTGEPKTISFTRDQLTASARMTEQALGLKSHTDALICIDTRYIGGKMMIVRSLLTGMNILAVDPCACPLQEISIDHCVNFAAFVPYQVKSMLGSKHPHLLNNVGTAIIGGAPIDDTAIEELNSYGCRCYATYGMTETLSHIALRKLNGKDRQPYFEALPGITLKQDARGCLAIQAPYLPDELITNDIVELISPKQFLWLGRWDNVINTGGVKVLPEKVEAAIARFMTLHGYTHRFFVYGIPDERLGNRVILVMEESGHNQELQEKIFPFLRASLTPYEIPKEICFSPSFVFTGSAKINRLKTLETIFSFYRPEK